jgi:hypothetical protein
LAITPKKKKYKRKKVKYYKRKANAKQKKQELKARGWLMAKYTMHIPTQNYLLLSGLLPELFFTYYLFYQMIYNSSKRIISGHILHRLWDIEFLIDFELITNIISIFITDEPINPPEPKKSRAKISFKLDHSFISFWGIGSRIVSVILPMPDYYKASKLLDKLGKDRLK